MADVAAAKHYTVQALNDRLRQHRIGGTVVVTPGVRALGAEVLAAIMTAVAAFDAFTVENDPRGEHDFGSIKAQETTVFFKIDCYDRDLCYHSPDPSDPAVTCRLMTLMLAEEY